MIYVVSGFMRSGTSMMMNALKAGGIQPYYSIARERMMEAGNKVRNINPDKFYEVGQQEYMRFGMVSEVPDECSIKIMAIGLPILAAAKGYRIIYMRRDPDAIRASYNDKFPADNFDRMFPTWPGHYWQLLDGVRGIMQARRDVYLTELWYDDVVDDPEKTVDLLIASGYPIVNRAAAIDYITPEHRRYGNLQHSH